MIDMNQMFHYAVYTLKIVQALNIRVCVSFKTTCVYGAEVKLTLEYAMV